MANPGLTTEDHLYGHDSTSPYFRVRTWPTSVRHTNYPTEDSITTVSPIHTLNHGLRQMTTLENPMMEAWRMQQQRQFQQQQQQQQQQQEQQQRHLHQDTMHRSAQHSPTLLQQQLQQQQQSFQNLIDFQTQQNTYNPQFDSNLHPLQTQTQSQTAQLAMIPISQSTMTTSLPIDPAYLHLEPGIDGMLQNWADFEYQLVRQHTTDLGPAVSPYQQPTNSPTGSHAEVASQLSSQDDISWTMVPSGQAFEPHGTQTVDPNHTIHYHSRALSESSYSDLDIHNHGNLLGNLDMSSVHATYSPTTPSDSDLECYHQVLHHGHSHRLSMEPDMSYHHAPPHAHAQTTMTRPVAIPNTTASSPIRSPSSQGSAGSPGRKGSRKSPTAPKATDKVTKRSSQQYKLDEKKIGRRKGPLRPEQKKHAMEIRKMGACLRCKFLKKTCDKGEPCAGCQPSHARLWQVPCTRIDIKEIGYFWTKDLKFDFERHLTVGLSVGNIKGFSDDEKLLWVTHGYGPQFPVQARKVFVREDNCLVMDWMESTSPERYEITTANMSVAMEGISSTTLSDYLDRHIDSETTFINFVDNYFENTPFLSEMLKTAHRFYYRTSLEQSSNPGSEKGSKIVKKALKLILAYNLTLHITMLGGPAVEDGFAGKIEDETSKFHGMTMAPVMINFDIKYAMSQMWRELHRDVLEELSGLYSSVYSGDKLKNWPTIFILASILLAVWEYMQFDCHYRVPDKEVVEKFCNDMESTPVGVIVGLFQAISQKLPALSEWDTAKHHTLLGSNPIVCDTMSEVRNHVHKYEDYLRERPQAKFDRKKFDSLSNKFLSRLVIRAN